MRAAKNKTSVHESKGQLGSSGSHGLVSAYTLTVLISNNINKPKPIFNFIGYSDTFKYTDLFFLF